MDKKKGIKIEKKLPIGIQNFKEIINEGYYYVDKTPFCLKLATTGKHYFLSRPRRFGKSLLIDTLAELFAGNQKLFEALYIYDQWDWSMQYPVIRISFGGGVVKNVEDLKDSIDYLLEVNQENLQIECGNRSVKNCFKTLIRQAHEKTGKPIEQLKIKNYAQKYQSLSQPIHLIGVEFSKVQRCVVGFDVETFFD